MAEHLRDEQVAGFRRRSLAPAELFAVGEHLAACEECRARLADARATAASVAALRADVSAAAEEFSHLAYEQLAAFVDNDLGEIDREIVQSHLSLCARCAEEARELAAFAAAMNIARDSAPTASPARHTPTLGERLAALLPARLPSLRTRGVLALLLILVGITLALLLARRGPADNRLAEAPRPTVEERRPQTEAPTPTAPSASPSSSVTPQTPAPPTTPAPRTNEATKVTPAEAVLALTDGGRRVTLDARGNLNGLDALTPADERAVKQALRTGVVAKPPELSTLFGSDGALMSGGAAGGADPFAVRGPAGTVVREARPTLRWNALLGATGYTVKVYGENYEEAASSPTLNANEWPVPVALERGRFYSWGVTALKDGAPLASAPAPPAPEARFKVLEQSKEQELSRALAAQPDSRLARAVIYARAGLLDDAERELQALARQNPRSATARRLLRSVRRK